MMIGPSAPNGPPEPIEIADEIGFRTAIQEPPCPPAGGPRNLRRHQLRRSHSALAASSPLLSGLRFEAPPRGPHLRPRRQLIPILLGMILVCHHSLSVLGLSWMTLAPGLDGLACSSSRDEPAAPPRLPQGMPPPADPRRRNPRSGQPFPPLRWGPGALGGSYRWSHFAAAHGLAAPSILQLSISSSSSRSCSVLFLHEAGQAPSAVSCSG